MSELAARIEAAEKPDILRFSVCTIPGRKGYTWGRVASDSEETMRLLCDMWNARFEIAAAIRGAPND